MKKALITGITGQDGSYLAEFLLAKDYEVHGLIRQTSSSNTGRINHLCNEKNVSCKRLILHYGDVSDSEQVQNILYKIQPDEVYHLAAQSQVRVSFDIPEYTGDITALGTTRILEVIRRSNANIKFYQASSSEMFGSSKPPQNEDTPFCPRSPYACAKMYAYWMTKNYREGYGIFASNGILFNHESPRRGESFVTRKITRAIVNILLKKQELLSLGNLDAKRDWGFTPEYVEVMWKMLQFEKPDDFVIGTGKAHSIKNFIEEAFSYVGLNWEKYVKTDPEHLRPTEVSEIAADFSKAKRLLGWQPRVAFRELVHIMMDAEMRNVGLVPPGEGDRFLQKEFPYRWWKAD